MQKRIFHLFLFLSVCLCQHHAVASGIYSWKDEAGKLYFGDRPPVNSESKELEIRVNTFQSPPVVTQEKTVAASRGEVVIYTTSHCGYCKKAKRYFRNNKISYREYDVEISNKGKRDFKKLNGRGVPIILVGDQRMDGFSEGRLGEMLKSSGHLL